MYERKENTNRMTIFFKTLLSSLLICFILNACNGTNVEIEEAASSDLTPEYKDNELRIGNSKNNLQATIKDMNLDEKIGQLVIVGVDGDTMDQDINQLIKKRKVGGIILFSKNLLSIHQSKMLINKLKQANTTNSVPLFMGLDEEGGRVTRLPNDFLATPSSEEIGNSNNLDWAYHTGQSIAKKVKSLGFNINFAPVLDINSNPNNPVIGDRSFGSTPNKVIEFGLKQIEGMHSQELISVTKHFPGHGDTNVDSHLEIPVIQHNKSRLEDFELAPFKAAIKQNVDAIMIGHLLVPAYDKQYPATLSKPIVTELLRGKLNYDGLIVTDDMTMGAIKENYDLGNAAVLSVQAGSDLVMVGHGYDEANDVLTALKQAVQSGEISEERINQSVKRILDLKESYRLTDQPIKDINVKKINKFITEFNSK
ncbi:beta-N-acetylhexosaminidase [Virgibacillus salexigens]|uniref:beta-N-acetylhexosaminidase n=1 Tax=Virgibacillus salexigens TaxID=61016 RepID=UPI00190D63AB|nr:beta-N-acetylhexosaminidase [Virgibacillus salexigens]